MEHETERLLGSKVFSLWRKEKPGWDLWTKANLPFLFVSGCLSSGIVRWNEAEICWHFQLWAACGQVRAACGQVNHAVNPNTACCFIQWLLQFRVQMTQMGERAVSNWSWISAIKYLSYNRCLYIKLPKYVRCECLPKDFYPLSSHSLCIWALTSCLHTKWFDTCQRK